MIHLTNIDIYLVSYEGLQLLKGLTFSLSTMAKLAGLRQSVWKTLARYKTGEYQNCELHVLIILLINNIGSTQLSY